MKKFFAEFKKFITRGNVVDMAVGVIVGSAFTAIVNGLSNNILKPIINYLLALIFGADSLSEIYTVLKPVLLEDGTLDLANSIYIDWGAFISAIINFLLIAIVLFSIVKIMNSIKENNDKVKDAINKNTLDRAEIKELKKAGVNLKDKDAVKAYFAKKEEQAKLELEKAEQEAKLAEEEAKKHTTEALLEDIKTLLEKQLSK